MFEITCPDCSYVFTADKETIFVHPDKEEVVIIKCPECSIEQLVIGD